MSAFCETIYGSAQKTHGLRKRLDAYCLEKNFERASGYEI